MGVAKQIPQLQPKAKERKSKKEYVDGGYIGADAGASAGRRERTHASVRTRWIGESEGEGKWEGRLE
jgi:hypothetical protein